MKPSFVESFIIQTRSIDLMSAVLFCFPRLRSTFLIDVIQKLKPHVSFNLLNIYFTTQLVRCSWSFLLNLSSLFLSLLHFIWSTFVEMRQDIFMHFIQITSNPLLCSPFDPFPHSNLFISLVSLNQPILFFLCFNVKLKYKREKQYTNTSFM